MTGTRALLFGGLCLLTICHLADGQGYWGQSRPPRGRLCPFNCLNCSDGSDRCVQCKRGFKLTQVKTCIPDTSECAANCLFCGKNGRNKCDYCKRQYILTLNKTCSTDAQCHDHCQICETSGENKCDWCDPGYFVTTNNTCMPCAEHCWSCQRSGQNKCDRCKLGYKLTNDKTCISSHVRCADHCNFCYWSGENKCDWCNPGYVRTQSRTCVPKIAPCAKHCWSCQRNGKNKCDLCLPGYKLTTDKTCASLVSCAAHCHFCGFSGKNKCDFCVLGYTLTSDRTCSQTAQCAEHCHSCLWSGENKCNVCMNGYTLTLDNTCSKSVSCAEHCLSCQQFGENKCDHCEGGYRRTYDNTCTLDTALVHPGDCPSLPPESMGTCAQECGHDYECPRDSKCCSNGCGLACIKTGGQTVPCAEHCVSCQMNGQNKCDLCQRGYRLTRDKTCTTSAACTEETEICLEEWNNMYQQSPRSQSRNELCNILPEVKECLEDLRTGCGEDGTWISYMRVMSDYEVNCAPSTVPCTTRATRSTSTTPTSTTPTSTTITSTTERMPTKTTTTTSTSTTERIPTKTSSPTSTSTSERIPTKTPTTTPTSTKASRRVVMVIRLSMKWKELYKDFTNQETEELVTSLETSLSDIYSRVKGFRDVQVQRLFKSSVGVEHFVEFDHDLTDAERTAIALTLTSALEANRDTLTVGEKEVKISGKAEMLVAGEKVEVNGACFLYDKKQLCKNGGSCVASDSSARCVCTPSYGGAYCETSASSAATGSKDVIGPVVGGIGAVLLVAILIFALLLYRKKSAEKTSTHMQEDAGVDNPIYAVYTGGVNRSIHVMPPPRGTDSPVYSG